jgi:tetratricopeptide (TPR) repeat protein
VHQYRSTVLARMGRLREAADDVGQALTLARPRGEPETVCYSLATLPLLAWLTGEREPCLAEAAEAIRVAEQTGNPAAQVMALEGMALGQLVARNGAEAVAASRRALTLARHERSALYEEASLLAYLALAYSAVGDGPAAQAAADEAVDVARRQKARVNECLALLVRAHVARLGSREFEKVFEDLDTSLALVAEVGAATFEPFISEELGRLMADPAKLQEAAYQYEAIGACGHFRRLEAELGRTRIVTG